MDTPVGRAGSSLARPFGHPCAPLAREGVDGLALPRSRSLGRPLPLSLSLSLCPSCSHCILARYLSRLQILTSYRYRGHSSILYILRVPLSVSRFPTRAIPERVLSRSPPPPPSRVTARVLAAARPREFRLMNYMYNI